MENFKKLGLSDETLKTIKKKGFEEPTEIQTLIIPKILEKDKDIIAQAQTGTGKTATFALPLIEKLSPKAIIQAIIIAPTRELVLQVTEEINSLKGNSKLQVVSVYGGQSIDLQFKHLKRGADIIVATPGRLIDHLNRGTINISNVKYFILDEADEMLNMGLSEDIETIFKKTPSNRRVLLFSATMPNYIKKLAENYMKNYEHVKTKTQLTTNLTEQIYFEVHQKDKLEALTRIIDIEPNFYGIVFCRTKVEVDEITLKLTERGYLADGIHGDISQAQRERTLSKFKKEITSLLIATDVAARGIDVDNLTHVINYSIPQNPEAYVHRIGRTGRAGKKGTAITFITPSEFRRLGFIKKVTNSEIKKEEIPDIKDIISLKKEKIEKEIFKNINTSSIRNWAKSLLEQSDYSAEDIVASLLELSFGKELDENSYKKIIPVQSKDINIHGKTRLFIAKGKNSDLTIKSLIKFIAKKAKISEDKIQNIEIHDDYSFINVPFSEAKSILEAFSKIRSKTNKPLIEEAKQKKNSQRRDKSRPRSNSRNHHNSKDNKKSKSGRNPRYNK